MAEFYEWKFQPVFKELIRMAVAQAGSLPHSSEGMGPRAGLDAPLLIDQPLLQHRRLPANKKAPAIGTILRASLKKDYHPPGLILWSAGWDLVRIRSDIVWSS